MNNSIELIKEKDLSQELNIPIFFVDLNECLNHTPKQIITGTVSSVLELENGSTVLLVNDFINPTLSVYATVQYLSTGLEGILYQYGYYQSDIGVPAQLF